MMNKKIIIFTIFILAFFQSCAHHTKAKRIPASKEATKLQQDSCMNLLNSLLNKDLENGLDEDLHKYILQRAEKYWKKNGKKPWIINPKRYTGPLRKKLVRFFYKTWKHRETPNLYIEDASETLIHVQKYEEIMKSGKAYDDLNKLEKEIWDDVSRWVSRYKNYKNQKTDYLRSYLSYEYAIKKLKKQLKTIKKFDKKNPLEVTVTVFEDGKLQVRGVTIFNKASYKELIYELKQEKNAISTNRIFKTDEIRKADLRQAKDKRRLFFILDRLGNIASTRRKNGLDPNEELSAKIKTIRNLIFDRKDLDPPPNIIIKLERQEIVSELLDSFRTGKQSNALRILGNIYKKMDNVEKERFNLGNSRGVTTRVINIVKKNRQLAILVSLSTGSGGAFNYEELYELFTFDSTKRNKCIEKEKDDEFLTCVNIYINDKFTTDHLIEFYFDGYGALITNLEENQEEREDIIKTVKSMAKRRKILFENKKREEGFQKTLKRILEEIVLQAAGEIDETYIENDENEDGKRSEEERKEIEEEQGLIKSTLQNLTDWSASWTWFSKEEEEEEEEKKEVINKEEDIKKEEIKSPKAPEIPKEEKDEAKEEKKSITSD